jgi:hypothetical protein
MLPGATSTTVDAKGLIKADANANFKLALEGASSVATDVTIAVDTQCIVDIELSLASQDLPTTARVKLRGVLIHEGKEILAIETDPGAMVTAAFSAP